MSSAWNEVIEALRAPTIVVDEAQRVSGLNAAATEMFASVGAELLHRELGSFFESAIRSSVVAAVGRTLRTGLHVQVEFEQRGRRLRLSAIPLGPSGETGALCFVTDASGGDRECGHDHDTEECYRDFFESANVGKAVTLPSGEFEVNTALAEMLGYTQEEMQQRNWREYTLPEDIEFSDQVLASLLSGEKDRTRFVKRYLRRDGSVVWADVSTVLRRDSEGRPLRFFTTLLDITEQRNAHRLRREAEERFAGAFLASPAGLTITDISDGRFVDVNDAFAEIVESTREELIGRTSREMGLWSGEDREQLIRRQIDSGDPLSAELRVTSRSGKIRDLLYSSTPVTLSGEQHLVTTLIDITERNRAQEKLRLTEARYRALFENMNAGFVLFEVVTDADGVPADLIIRAANRGFAEAVQRSIEEVIDLRVTEVVPGIENDPANWIGTYGEVALTGVPRTFENTSDALGRHYSVNAYRSGDRQCAVTFQDVTERVRLESEGVDLERQLQHARKLESVGRLAGGVAHDFNNMLFVILAHAESILDALAESDPLRDPIAEILDAGRRSADLTQQLLAFSRKQPMLPRVVDLNVALEDLERMLSRLIDESINLTFRFLPTAGRIMVDPSQLEQVVVNLIVNARDAMKNGGDLVVEVHDVVLDRDYLFTHRAAQPGRYTMLSVSDTGAGMTRDVIERIFEPFFTTKLHGRGSGLGLATTYGIVKQSGGSIWVYSEPGLGTTFKVYFPATEDQPSPPRAPRAQPTQGKGQLVLVVEDEASVRRLIGAVLTRLGYRSVVAGDPDEAIRIVELDGAVPDLVLTDLVMPGIGGGELVERLRRSIPNLRCLLMSGYTDDTITLHGLVRTEETFLQKPFAIEELAEKIQYVLSEG